MTTLSAVFAVFELSVVEAYRLDRYDNFQVFFSVGRRQVVEAYRLDRYDNLD